MGGVYEAFDRDRGIPVALKTLSHVSPAALFLFKQEFRSIADISHPNLVSLYELFAGKEWFFTMQLLDGLGLLEFLRRDCRPAIFDDGPRHQSDLNSPATVDTASPYEFRTEVLHSSGGPASPPSLRRPQAKGTAPDAERIRTVMHQVVKGIAALHAAGKLHRDIKPSNVMVDVNGRATVLDFGLAVDQGSLRESGPREVVGTFPYMSPEQLVGLKVSAASDWYSVGIMIYQCLCGELPFGGYSNEMIAAKRENVFPAPSEIAEGVDPDLERLVMDLLQSEPSRRPDSGDLLSRLGNGVSAAVEFQRERLTTVSFFGRHREQRLLDDALSATLAGTTAFALVHGASGVGKSALLQHYVSRNSGHALVLRGRCYEQESVPYKAIDSAMDALCQHLLRLRREQLSDLLPQNIRLLAQLFPVLNRLEERVPLPPPAQHPTDPRRLRRRAVEVLRELFSRLRLESPVILLMDDLQWGDVDSITLLSEIFAPPFPPAVLVLCTYRREYEASSRCLSALLELRKTNASVKWFDVAVEPFSKEETLEFAKNLIGGAAQSETTAQWIAEESDGSPYFVLELARHSESARKAKAPGLEDVLRERISELTSESRYLLEVVAVHGKPLAQIDAYRAAGLSGRDPAHLTALRFANLVRSSGTNEDDQVESFHDRVRETVLHGLPQPALRSRHHGLAQTLESSGRADDESLAFHFENAGAAAKAGAYYSQAGDRAAAALAFDRAAAHYRRSLELLKPAAQKEAELRGKLADTLVNLGRSVDAAREYELAAERSPAATKLDLERRAAFHYTSSGRLHEGNAVFERVLGRVSLRVPKTPTATLVSMLWNAVRLRLQGTTFEERDTKAIPQHLLDRIDAAWSVAAPMGMINTAQGMNFGLLSLLLAMKAGDPVRFVYGLQVAAYAMALEGPGGRARALRLIDQARSIVAQRDDPRLHATLLFTEAAVAYVKGEWVACWRVLEQAEELFAKRARGVHWELASIRTLQLYSLQTMGNFADLRSRCGPFLQEAEELGDLYSRANIETYCEPMALLARDQPDAARACVLAGLKRWQVEGYHLQNAMAAHSLAWIAIYEGRAATNLDFVERQWQLMHANHIDRFDNMRVAWWDFRFRTALAAAVSPDTSAEVKARAWRIAEKASEALRREATGWGRATSLIAEAAMAEVRRDASTAPGCLLNAASQFDRLDMLGYAWAARRRAGELIGGERGSELLASADEWFRRQSVVRPERVAAAHVAGFRAPVAQGEAR